MKNQSGPFQRQVGALALALGLGVSPVSAIAADSPVSSLYEIRSQVIEGVQLARSLMTCVADEFAHVLELHSCSGAGSSGQYVDAVSVQGGRIDIVYGTSADAAIAGKTLSLTPYKTADDHVVWRCGNRPKPPGLQPLWGDHTEYQTSTVDDRHSSAACAMAAAFPDPVDYRGDVLRERVVQSIRLAGQARKWIEESAVTARHLDSAAYLFNEQSNGVGLTSPYVISVQIASSTGVITLAFNESTMGLAAGQNTLTLTPFVSMGGAILGLDEALALGIHDSIVWGCASESANYAGTLGLLIAAPGTLKSQYAPPECR